jgi:transcriptional regulator of acetoin/glycerol metabolism
VTITWSQDTGPATGRRPEIELSWHRCRLAGVDPATAPRRLTAQEVDDGSAFLAAAGPVLDRLHEDLTDTGHVVMLTDRDCAIVHRWTDSRPAESTLDWLGAVPGAVLAEDVLGTNAPGTATETGRAIVVHGSEHFAEDLKQFSCYGLPVRHPLTRRIEGVLDVTSVAERADPLLAPLLRRAVSDIEERLLDAGRASERHLLHAYQAATARRGAAVVALDDEVVVASRAALDLLSPEDYAALRVVVRDLVAGLGSRDAVAHLPLTSGREVSVHAQRVTGTDHGAVVLLRPAADRIGGPHGAGPTGHRPADIGTAPVLVAGPTGSGRTTTARAVAGSAAPSLDAVRALVLGPVRRAQALRDLLAAAEPVVVVENVDVLPADLLRLLVEHVSSGARPRLVLTSGPLEALPAAARPLAALCLDRHELRPLADRGTEMAEMAARALQDVAPGSTARLTPSVIEVLAGQPWPGGLHELQAVMRHVGRHRTVGDVVVADLPSSHRSATSGRSLSALERAERDAIVRTLQAHGGNKVRAAAELGVSRTTLYARMRSLRISEV